MNNKIIYAFLAVVLIFTLINFVDSCNYKRTANKILIDQLKRNDSTETELKKIIEARKDTIINNNYYQTKIIKEGEQKKDEIFNTINIDSIVTNYYKYRPDKVNNSR